MELQFEKWHGCHNDFIVLSITEADGDIVLNSLKRQAPKLCDRHAGIGADGLLVLWRVARDQVLPHRLSIINSDGSIAQNCGNGLRCAASSVLKAVRDREGQGTFLEMVDLSVEGKSKVCRFLKPNQINPLVAVEMGVPILNEHLSWWQNAQDEVRNAAIKSGVGAQIQEIAACDLGNRHLVLTSDHASRDLIKMIGPKLQVSKHWDGINVHIIRSHQVTDKDLARAKNDLGQDLSEIYQAFVWERGAGETMACGSGAAAIGVAALSSGLIERDSWIGIDMPGGRLYVKQEQDDESVILAGPAAFVFRGTLTI